MTLFSSPFVQHARRSALWLGLAATGCHGMDSMSMSYAPEGGAPLPAAPPVEPDAPAINGFVSTRDDALATFAVDVDTASYTRARSAIERGELPAQSEVRVEEFINYFASADEAPQGDDAAPFAVHLEAAPSPFGEGLHLLRVHLAGREVPPAERPRANLVFLVDVSGSMASPDKLGLVQHALTRLTETLRADDTVGVVVYAGQAGVLLEPTPAAQRGRILSAIESLTAGGSTNGEGGIRAAYALASDAFIRGGINRVVLCTDGDFNVGVTGDALVELVEAEKARGITLTTAGFGQSRYNDAQMEALADHGDGNALFMDSPREAERAFVADLQGTLQVIAKDAKVQVELDPRVVQRWRLVGYENRDVADEDFANDRVDGGEIGAGHRVTAFIELELTPDAAALDAAVPLATVSVRAKAPDGVRSAGVERALALDALRADASEATDDFLFGAAVAEVAEVLRASPFVGATAASLEVAEALAAEYAGDDPEKADFVTLVGRVRTLVGP